MEPEHLVQMLKAVKHLSMNANLLEVLQNANAIEILIKLLDKAKTGFHSTVHPLLKLIHANTHTSSTTARKCPITFSRHAITSVG